jgi:hypothetical protein
VFDTTLDASGSVLYLSSSYHAVFRITNTPAITSPPQLIAGSNSAVNGATDGPALAATFNYPRGITSDTTNNIAYISDYSNYRIRTLHLTGTNNSNSNPGSYTVATWTSCPSSCLQACS